MFKRRDKSEKLLVPKRSTTKAKRFNALSIFYIYKELTDKIDLVKIGNEFAEKLENRKSVYGKFSHDDFKV